MGASRDLTAVAINCSLKKSGSGQSSSTDRMISVIADAFAPFGVALQETIRISEHDILPGVTSDEGPGDAWPDIRARILSADILIFGTLIWLGQPSSLAKRVLERMDAFFSEMDEQGRTPAFNKIAVLAIVGNEDGAHHVTAELFQALNDVGWTIPPMASCYWVGEAMHKKNFEDLRPVPREVSDLAGSVAASAAHLARLIKGSGYPGNRTG